MHGEGKRIPSIVETPRNAEVEGGAPEQQMTTYHRENGTQEDSHCQKCTGTEKFRYPRIEDQI
jgi:hypothetical protein